MRYQRRMKYLIFLCCISVFTGCVKHLGWDESQESVLIIRQGERQEIKSSKNTETKSPHKENTGKTNKSSGVLQQNQRGIEIPDAKSKETNKLISILQQKLKELNDSGLMLTTKQREVCQKGSIFLCIDPNCTKQLPHQLSEVNIESVRKPVREVGMDKLREAVRAFDVKPEKKKYVIITGASSNHFQESEAALQSLHKYVLPYLTNYSFYYYDLGLTEEEKRLVRDGSGAELRTFPYDKLPRRFRQLHCYIWKPLIILAHLQSAEFLLWMDSSMQYRTDIRPYFELAEKTGILITRNTFSFAQHVYLKMFSYFGDEPCQFSSYGETEGGFLVLHNEPFTRHLIIEPWSACALDPNCMCPEETKRLFDCSNIQKYGICHRYDQATIGYILIKLLRRNRESVIIQKKIHAVRRGQRPSYLKYLQKPKV